MSKSGRLMEILQALRGRRRPVTAAHLAADLDVSERTIYRDIATLQAHRVPIDGAAGIGYVLEAGYQLPQLDFDAEELEAIRLGLAMIPRSGDSGLMRAARRAMAKLEAARPMPDTLHSSDWGVAAADQPALGLLRGAVRDERVVSFAYQDATGAQTERRVRPVAVLYYAEVVVLAAWCEGRGAFRHFRTDRMQALALADTGFVGQGAALRQAWQAEREAASGMANFVDRS